MILYCVFNPGEGRLNIFYRNDGVIFSPNNKLQIFMCWLQTRPASTLLVMVVTRSTSCSRCRLPAKPEVIDTSELWQLRRWPRCSLFVPSRCSVREREICCFCPKMEKAALMSCDHQQKSKKGADVTEGSWGLVCLDSAPPALLSSLCPSSKTKSEITLALYHSAHRLSSYVLSSDRSQHPLLALVVKHFSGRAEAALGLFSAALLSAAEQSSSGSSQARKRLCTSASRERGEQARGGGGIKGREIN